MMEYRLAEDRDMAEIIDLINMVFSMVRIPHDFPVLLPKVYAEPNRRSDIHMLAHEDGALCGVFGLLPFELVMTGGVLSCGYLGSMAVHPRARGRGVMGELCRRLIDRGIEKDMDLLVLGGQRQRYEHSGFCACGSRMRYIITRANIRHCLREAQAGGIAFRPLEAGGEDEAFAFALYGRQTVTGAREKKSFVPALRSYWNDAWTICRGDTAIGYLMASGDGRCIYELVLEDEAMLPAVLKAWVEQKNASPVSLVTAPHEAQRNRFLAGICEGYSCASDEMFLCLKPDRVIEAYLRLKKTYVPLEDGELKLGFGSFGTIRISVCGTEIIAEKTLKEPDLMLDDQQAHAFAFGCDRSAWMRQDVQMPRGWFPLHLHIPEADRF